MSQHLGGGPLIWVGGGPQVRWPHIGGQRGEARRRLGKQGQHLRAREGMAGHVLSSPFRSRLRELVGLQRGMPAMQRRAAHCVVRLYSDPYAVWHAKRAESALISAYARGEWNAES